MSTHTSLDAAATERKARLAKLKSLKRKQPTDDEETAETRTDDAIPIETASDPTKTYLSGRNYDTEAKGAKLGFEYAPNADISTLEIRAKQIADETTQAAVKEAEDDKGIDLFKLQPKKPNWDLKRDLAKKMEILNVRTDNAIAKMVRERIAAQQKAQREKTDGSSIAVDADGEEAEITGLKGEELVEGIHQREREEAEDEKEDEEDDDERI
ncbi:MAG: hypothetical protein GOMPHAMPRED_004251 [Gomphillus americanus]|uniref:Uncharacterized protein n=1 Tax=Gomphillus americanus TaxID=1940652 RepID=A0A8H3FKQ8_9LECA|nr:MAG: hypothetical protein GOMPHAMPRED_004251 [Gomphillus americanus]